MSASNNPSSLSNQGEFHSGVPPSEPLTTKGHAPGVKVGNEAAPEFSAQTLPAGTAPADRTFRPNTQNEIPGQANNPNISKETWTSAQDTIGGATSADVHTGYGHPGIGETSQELHGSGKKERSGLSGVGADQSDRVRDRGLDVDVEKGSRGKSGNDRQDILGAEERD
ncbi:hypothetical protein L207DRAFT_437584 [Hyaloscypha variabilis F]|uniref:Uncharacterized protein n=1 Tax=Hyaloscypha variabilis (strain UAMH 11265 / GT02V1 / F) TaxID=1149755 RepID=A0A2J6R6B5_HYAVF|nr:hypothetical protein L207DRAFT_437584 [Hyaloscypha variabilis F]